MSEDFSLPPPPTPTVHSNCKSKMAGRTNDRELLALARTSKTPPHHIYNSLLRMRARVKRENHPASHSAHGWALLEPRRTSLTHKCRSLPMLTLVTWKSCHSGSKPVSLTFRTLESYDRWNMRSLRNLAC